MGFLLEQLLAMLVAMWVAVWYFGWGTMLPPAAAPAAPAVLGTPTTAATESTPSAVVIDSYVADIRPILNDLGAGVDAMGKLMAAPNIADDQWRDAAKRSFEAIQAGHTALLDVQPPPQLHDVHELLTAGTQKCSQGAQVAVDAIDSDNTLGLYAATELFLRCGEDFNTVNKMLTDMRK